MITPEVQKDVETAYVIVQVLEETKGRDHSRFWKLLQERELLSSRDGRMSRDQFPIQKIEVLEELPSNFHLNAVVAERILLNIQRAPKELLYDTAQRLKIPYKEIATAINFLTKSPPPALTQHHAKICLGTPSLPSPCALKPHHNIDKETFSSFKKNLLAKGFNSTDGELIEQFLTILSLDDTKQKKLITAIQGSPQEFISLLTQMVWDEITPKMKEGEFDTCLQLLDISSKKLKNREITDTDPQSSFKIMGQIFGDHFIKDVSLDPLHKIEGGLPIAYAQLIASFMKEKEDILLKFSSSKKLQCMLENAIDLNAIDPKDLLPRVKQLLEQKGIETCLFLGGWAGHNVIYEIEKQSDGKYSFRVYNKGEGIRYFKRYIPEYTEKVSPCFAIKDIEEKTLLSKVALGCLKALSHESAVGGKVSSNFLSAYLLPQFGGSPEDLPPEVQQAVSIQKSGTCAYAPFAGLFARSFPAKDYKVFKAEFKLFILEHFRSKLRKILFTDIQTESDYKTALFTLDLFDKSIERFSKSIAKLEHGCALVGERAQAARKEILIYQHSLKKLRTLIEAYEERVSGNSTAQPLKLFSLILPPDASPLRPKASSPANPLAVASLFLRDEEFSFLNRLTELPSLRTSTFPKAWEHALTEFARIACNPHLTKDEFLRLCDAFLRKVACCGFWENISYANPQQAFSDLHTITEKLRSLIQEGSPAEHYLMFLYTCYGAHHAYQLIKDVPNFGKHPPMFPLTLRAQIEQLQCSDGFWVARAKELCSLPETPFPFPAITASISESSQITLSPEMADIIWKWWLNKSNEPLRTLAEKSIKHDREEQASLIARDIARAQIEKRKLEEERPLLEQRVTKEEEIVNKHKKEFESHLNQIAWLRSLGGGGEEERKLNLLVLQDHERKIAPLVKETRDLDQSHEALSQCIKQIESLERAISNGIKRAYEVSDKYWPANFETEALSEYIKASFLFIPQAFFLSKGFPSDDLLPSALRTYCSLAMRCNTIFYKKHFSSATPSPLTIPFFSEDPRKNDMHKVIMSFPNDPSLNKSVVPTNRYQGLFTRKAIQLCESFLRIPEEEAFKAVDSSDPLPDEAIEIIDLRAAPGVQLSATMNYFLENMRYLSNREYLSLFHKLFFDGHLLVHELENEQKRDLLIKNLRNFFSTVIEYYRKTDDRGAAANLLWVSSSLENYIYQNRVKNQKQAEQKSPRKEECLVEDDLRIKLFEEALSLRDKDKEALFFHAFFASCHWLPMEAPEEMVLFIANEKGSKLFTYWCASLLLQGALSQEDICSLRADDWIKSRLLLQKILTFATTKNDPLKAAIQRAIATHLPSVLGIYYPELARCSLELILNTLDEWRILEGKTHLGSLALSSGQLVFSDPTKQKKYNLALPTDIIHALKEKNIFSSEDFPLMRCHVEVKGRQNQYYIVTTKEDGPLYIRFNVTTKALYLRKKSSARWLKHYAATEIPNAILRNRYVILQDEGLVEIWDKTTLSLFGTKPIGKTFFQKAKNSLYLLDPPHLFSSFEDPACTLCFGNEKGNPREISFPRLNISLRFKESGEWELVDQPGWFLAKTQFVPNLGKDTGRLVVVNEKGERRVLLPVWDPICPLKQQPLGFSYLYNFQEIVPTDATVAYYTLLENGELAPLDPLARFYLARIFLEKGDHDRAERLLLGAKALLTNRKLSMKETEILQNMIQYNVSGFAGPRAARIRIQALLLLERNEEQFPAEGKLVGKENFSREKLFAHVERLAEYLQKMKGATPLEKEDELFLLTQVLKKVTSQDSKDPKILDLKTFLERRQQELAGTTALSVLSRPPEKRELLSAPPLLEPPTRSGLKGAWDKLVFSTHFFFGSLPFDPTTVSAVEFQRFLPKIQKTLQYAFVHHSLPSANLIPALTYMALCHSDENTRTACIQLIRDLPEYLSITSRDVRIVVPEKLAQKITSKNLQELCFIRLKTPPEGVLPGEEPLSDLRQFFDSKEKEPPQEGLPIFHESCPEICDDATVKNKFSLAQQDIHALQCKEKERIFFLKDAEIPLEGIKACLLEKIKIQQKGVLEKEQNISRIVTAALREAEDGSTFAAKVRALPSVTDLSIILAKPGGKDLLRKKYPEFSEEAAENIKQSIISYLVEKQTLQRLQRALDQINPKDPHDPQMIHATGSTLCATRAYALADKNALLFLLVEIANNITLRKDQIETVNIFIESMNAGQPIAIEKIMGSGKTSVLQPILAILLAQQGKVSVVDVPDALFPQVRDQLVSLLGTSFDQYVYIFDFNSDKAKDPGYLETFLSKIKEMRTKEGCLLRIPRMKHSLLTNLMHAYATNDQKRIQLLAEILSLLQFNEDTQIDEINDTMNPLVIYRLPLIKHGEVLESIDQDEGAILADLLLTLAEDKTFNQLVSLDFIQKFRSRANKPLISAPLLTEESLPVVRERIAEIAVALLKEKISSLQKYPTDTLKAFLLQNWQGNPTLCEEITTTIKKTLLQREIDLIGVLTGAINSILPISLFKTCGATYGSDPNPMLVVARPYIAPGAPKPTEFRDPYELAVYSIQLTLHEGIPKNSAKELLTSLQKKAHDEIEEGVSPHKTQAYKELERLLGKETALTFPLTDTTSLKDLDLFHLALSRDKDSILQFFNRKLFSQIKIYKENATSTPQTLAGSSRVVGGYTGTLLETILPPHTKSMPEAGVNAQTILAVTNAIDKKEASILRFHEKEGLLNQVIKEFSIKESPHTVFIDSGGWLKEAKIEDFAKQLLLACRATGRNLHGIVFHNAKNEIVAWEIHESGEMSENPVPVGSFKGKTDSERYLTIISQKNEKGTNIPQALRAHALISIRKDMGERDLLQSIFRMRKILDTQKASFAISDEVCELMRSRIVRGLRDIIKDPKRIETLPPDMRETVNKLLKKNRGNEETTLKEFAQTFDVTIRTVWRFVTTNEALEEQRKNWIAAQHKMREIVAKPIRMALSDTSLDFDMRQKLFSTVAPLFIETETLSPFERNCHGTTVFSAQEAITRDVKKFQAFVSLVERLSSNDAAKKALSLIRQTLGIGEKKTCSLAIERKLQEVVSLKDISSKIEILRAGESQEMEQEAETQVEAESEVEIDIEKELLSETARIPPYLNPIPYEPLPHVVEMLRSFQQKTFCPRIVLTTSTMIGSQNLPFQEKITWSKNALPENFVDWRNTPGRFLLAMTTPQENYYIILSHKDAEKAKEELTSLLQKGEDVDHMQLLSLDGLLVASSGIATEKNPSPQAKQELATILIITKIFTGKALFTQQEIDHLDRLHRNKTIDDVGMRKLKTVYEIALQTKPKSAKAYNGRNKICDFFLTIPIGEVESGFIDAMVKGGLSRDTNLIKVMIEHPEGFGSIISILSDVLVRCALPSEAYKKFQKDLLPFISTNDFSIAPLGLDRTHPHQKANIARFLKDTHAWINTHWDHVRGDKTKIRKLFGHEKKWGETS